LAAGLLPLTGLGVGSVAHASQTDSTFPTFTSSPRSGPPGTVITASGTGCPGATNEGGVSLAPVGSQQPTAAVKIKPNAKGNWSSTLKVPSNAPVGEYLVSAICTFESGTPNVYRENSFTVTPVTVSPAEKVPAGSAPQASARKDAPPTTAASVGSPPKTLSGTNVASPSDSEESSKGGTILPWALAGLGGMLLLGAIPVIRRFRSR